MKIVATIWNFIVRQSLGNWILDSGYWDDDGVWVDTEVWKDGPTGDSKLHKFTVTRESSWVFKVAQSLSNWILSTGYWNDDGIWIDGEVWRDGPADVGMASHTFKLDRESAWKFIVKPSTYWILKTGYWDNKGIWVNHEIWRIP